MQEEIIYQPGDQVILVSERVDRWNSQGHMDYLLGATITLPDNYDGNKFHIWDESGQQRWTIYPHFIVGLAQPVNLYF